MAPIAKRRKIEAVEEISFDPASREQYLTGFHKRKQQRIKNAQETAAKREREEKIKQRKDVRDCIRFSC
jgi:ribosomal RNA-processing protein 17